MSGSLVAPLVQWDIFPFPEPWFFGLTHSARFLGDRWRRICREAVEQHRVSELHAARDDVFAVFDRLIAFHKSYLGLLALQQEVMGETYHLRWPPEELVRELDELVKLQGEIFPRWQTQDDLYQLLIDQFTLPADKLDAIAAKHPPPQSWYDETDDPFSAD